MTTPEDSGNTLASTVNGLDVGREILRLSIPAFFALVAEPLFLMADTAIVGRLGTPQLAGLGIASSILLTAVGLFVFVAYGTTSTVARRFGAGRRADALEAGFDGVWLAGVIGLVVALIVGIGAHSFVGAFGSNAEVSAQASIYLRISALGVPFTLVSLAITGVLRGFQDTKTPMVVSIVTFAANIVLNVMLVYGFGMGIAGSAWGTVVAQLGMMLALLGAIRGRARGVSVRIRPHPMRVLRAARDGVPLFIRTVILRVVLVLTTVAATRLGEVPLASFQVTMTIWSATAFALDALAIAAQAMIGRWLGAGDLTTVHRLLTTLIRWSVGFGVLLGAIVIVARIPLAAAFTSDDAVRSCVAIGLIVVGILVPVGAVSFIADGVLIGAGDFRWLAKAMALTLIGYLPPLAGAVWLVRSQRVPGWLSYDQAALTYLWLAFAAFLLIRAGLMMRRLRSDRWYRVGQN